MRITEEKLHNFADYIKKFKNKNEAFKQFQQKEIQHFFANNQMFSSSESRKKQELNQRAFADNSSLDKKTLKKVKQIPNNYLT